MKGEKGGAGRASEGFEDLHVYQRARVSIMSNVAEGFERGAAKEFIQSLYIAKGSCGEVRAQLAIAGDQGYISQADYDGLHDLSRRVSGMLSNLIAHLQRSSYRGEKYHRPSRLAVSDT